MEQSYTLQLLHRAQVEGLKVRRDPDDPKVAWVSSSSIKDHWYRVTRHECSCPAFLHRGDCKHRVVACHLADTGQLPFAGRLKAPCVAPVAIEPTLHELRVDPSRCRPGTGDATRLAWSYYS